MTVEIKTMGAAIDDLDRPGRRKSPHVRAAPMADASEDATFWQRFFAALTTNWIPQIDKEIQAQIQSARLTDKFNGWEFPFTIPELKRGTTTIPQTTLLFTENSVAVEKPPGQENQPMEALAAYYAALGAKRHPALETAEFVVITGDTEGDLH